MPAGLTTPSSSFSLAARLCSEPQQALGQITALDDQLAQRLLDVSVVDDDGLPRLLVSREQCGLAEQLADERTGRALSALDEPVEVADP